MGISLRKKTYNQGPSSSRQPSKESSCILNSPKARTRKSSPKRRRATLTKPRRPSQKEKPAKTWSSWLCSPKTRRKTSIPERKGRAKLTKSRRHREKEKRSKTCWSRNKKPQPPNQTDHGAVLDQITVPDIYVYASSLARNAILPRTRIYQKNIPKQGNDDNEEKEEEEEEEEVHDRYEEALPPPPRASAPVNPPPIDTLVQWTATKMSRSSKTYVSPQGSARTIGPILEDEVLDVRFGSDADADTRAAAVGDLEEPHEEFGSSTAIEEFEEEDGERQQWLDDVWGDWGH